MDGPDPLTDMSCTHNFDTDTLGSGVSDSKFDVETLWSLRVHAIAEEFKIPPHLPLIARFNLPSDIAVNNQNNFVEHSRSFQGLSKADKLKARLEQLESLEACASSIKQITSLTQEQFTSQLQLLKKELLNSWESDQRVKALKIVLQCIKILGDSVPEQFYPSKFVLIVDILETLASLVFRRLQSLSNDTSGSLTLSNPEASETAKNWFYKVSSVRELLPKIYLEAALLPCFAAFSCRFSESLKRLTSMARGVGDPLVAAYLRMYIGYVSQKLLPLESSCIVQNIEDIPVSIKWGWNGNGIQRTDLISDRRTERRHFLRPFEPPVQFLLEALSHSGSLQDFENVFQTCQNAHGSAQLLLLMNILGHFPASYVVSTSRGLIPLIEACKCDESQVEMLMQLGRIVMELPPPNTERLQLLNSAWKTIVKLPLLSQYLQVIDVWLPYTCKYFSEVEVNKLLGDVAKRFQSVIIESQQELYDLLLNILKSTLNSSLPTESIYKMENFQILLALFQQDVGRLRTSTVKGLLESLLMRPPAPLSDPVLVQFLLLLATLLHESINALTTEDEKRQLSQLLTSFVYLVDYRKNLESQLEFYVSARAAFANLDLVLTALIQCVCRMCVVIWQMKKCEHSGQTVSFVHACIAYAFITIPSLNCPLTRVKLYIVLSSVAMLNKCLGQGEASIKNAIRDILELPEWCPVEHSESLDGIEGTLMELISLLVAVPDPASTSHVLYYFHGLTNAIQGWGWNNFPEMRVRLSLSVIEAVAAVIQENLPYNVHGVEGNNVFYGGDDILENEAERLCTTLLNDVILYLNSCPSKRCAPLSFRAFHCITTLGDLHQVPLFALALALWKKCLKESPVLLKKTKEALYNRALASNSEKLLELLSLCLT